MQFRKMAFLLPFLGACAAEGEEWSCEDTDSACLETDSSLETDGDYEGAAGNPTTPTPGWGPDGYGPGLVRDWTTPPMAKDGVGAFRMMRCTVSHENYDDPIVYPNQVGAAHRHSYFGNRTVNAYSTQESLDQGSTTCPGGIRNMSGYWFPSMLNASGQTVHPTDIWYYWKSGGHVRSTIKDMPVGLRVVMGGDLPSPNSFVRWQGCADWKGSLNGCKPGQLLILTISSNHCWDGKNLDSPDHKSHMTKPLGWAKSCPWTHPVPVPQVTFRVHWKIPASGAAGWRLSSDKPGQPAGQSAHADFWNAWKPEVMKAFTQYCIKAGRSCNNGELGNGWRLVKL